MAFISSRQFAAGFAIMAGLLGAGTIYSAPPAAGPFLCTVAAVPDGDSLRCTERRNGRPIRVRLSGIAAREVDGSCQPGHPCPAASASASTAALEALALGRTLRCTAVGKSYGRIAAFCRNSSGVDLSCAMVEGGYAAKWRRHWGNHRCRS